MGSGDETDPAPGRVLVVDDDHGFLKVALRLLSRAGFEARGFQSGEEAIASLEADSGWPDTIVSDLQMPVMDGLDLLRTVRDRWPELPVVLMTANSSVATAVKAMRLGAYDYMLKPMPGLDEVAAAMSRAIEHRRLVARAHALERRLDVVDRFGGIVGAGGAMREVFELIRSVAPTDASVLLCGESGTGKELVARAIHNASRRKARSFLPVNCSALSETLLESELFGHVRGAFTGAHSSRRGLFEEATGGTLFLDEIGDVPAATQVRLLRVLQEGEVKPVGANEARRVDVRVVAATHRDLPAMVRAGTFREDLYYRLNVIAVELPALRDRPEDVPLLVQHFLRKHAEHHGKPVLRVTPEALEAIVSHRWPGNVRELENALQRAVILARGDAVTLDTLPPAVRSRGGTARRGAPVGELPYAKAREDVITSFEREYFEAILSKTGGNVAEAARLSGLDRANFRRVARRNGIDLSRFRDA
ncbi:MAG: sigma-54-dependent Fis family transcriptional regulator [Deltaproteobacteria bacterium]|nr:sigma-54-dependent Fis family transcriptional regulator [Deltaproteobacteria bacterium]